MSTYLTVNTTFELICFLTACFCLYNDKQPEWRFLIFYLFIICLTELSAIYIRKVVGSSNTPLYNLFLIVECLSVSVFFYYLYKRYVNRIRWLVGWLSLFAICYAVEMWSNPLTSFASKTTSLLSFVFALACLHFYYLMLKDEKFEKLGNHAPFWWVNGTLIFYFGSTATNIFFDYLILDHITKFHQSIRYIIFNILNVFLYGCWSYAIICRYLQRKSFS
jgi:hypothetical protein